MAGPCYKSMDNKSDFIITLRQRISSVALKVKNFTPIFCVCTRSVESLALTQPEMGT